MPTILNLGKRTRRFAVFCSAWIAISMLGAEIATAQPYPQKTIRIVTSGAGGGSDFTSRLISQGIAAGLGQSVIVDNRANGGIAGEVVSKAPADGYTLLVS